MSAPTNAPATRRWGPQSSLDRVFDALEATGRAPAQRKVDVKVLCPVHDERTPSLHVTWRQSEGRTALWCFGCGAETSAILDALGLSLVDLYDDPPECPRCNNGTRHADVRDCPTPADRRHRSSTARTGRSSTERTAGRGRRLGAKPKPLLASPAPEPTAGPVHGWEEVATYSYVDAGAALVQQVHRRHCLRPVGTGADRHEACGAKEFKQSYIDARGETVPSAPKGFTPVLYRLPEVLQAVAAGQPVWLVEGEKDVEAAEAAGVVATTNTGGAGGLSPVAAEALRGADVVAVLDRDLAGYQRGEDLHRKLAGVAASLRLVLPALEAAKSDLHDHLSAGHGLDELVDVDVVLVKLRAQVEKGHRALGDEHGGLAQCELEALLRHEASLARDSERVVADDDGALVLAPGARAGLFEQLRSSRVAHQAVRASTAAQHEQYAQSWAGHAQVAYERFLGVIEDARTVLVDATVTRGEDTRWDLEVDTLEGQVRTAQHRALEAHRHAGLQPPPSTTAHLEPLLAQKPATPTVAAAVGAPAADGRGGEADGGDDQQAPQVMASAAAVPRPRSASTAQDRALLGRSDPQAVIKREKYEVLDGQLVKVTDEDKGLFKLLLGVAVQLEAVETAHDGDDVVRMDGLIEAAAEQQDTDRAPREEVLATPEPTHAVLSYLDPRTEQRVCIRVPYEALRDASWLSMLPIKGLYYRSGLSQRLEITDAMRITSTETAMRRLHLATGWHLDEDGGWRYFHARGSIGPDGWADASTMLTGPHERYDLPDPSTDATRLRQAFLQDSAALMDLLPTRVAAPLLGTTYKAAVHRNPFTTVLAGGPGSLKTSIAALLTQHYGEAWDRNRPLGSMTASGDTANALVVSIARARHALALLDDVSLTDGSVADVQKRFGQRLQLLFNETAKLRLNPRDHNTVRQSPTPAATVLITSEVVPPVGAAQTRSLVVPLRKGEIELETYLHLDHYASRHARALLTSSMIQWLAGDYPGHVARTEHARTEFQARLKREGLKADERQRESVAHCWAGWVTMTGFLVERGALSHDEREQWLQRVHAGLVEAVGAAQDPDLPTTTGQRFGSLLAHALSAGKLYARDLRTGQCPETGARGLGWQPGLAAMAPPHEVEWRPDRQAVQFGWVDPQPTTTTRPQLLVTRDQLDHALHEASAMTQEPIASTVSYAVDALVAEKIMLVPAGGGRRQFDREIHCEQSPTTGRTRRQKVYVLDLARLLGEDDPEQEGDGPSGGPDGGPGGQDPHTDPQPSPATLAEDSVPPTLDLPTPSELDPTPALLPAAAAASTVQGPTGPEEHRRQHEAPADAPTHAPAPAAADVDAAPPGVQVGDGGVVDGHDLEHLESTTDEQTLESTMSDLVLTDPEGMIGRPRRAEQAQPCSCCGTPTSFTLDGGYPWRPSHWQRLTLAQRQQHYLAAAAAAGGRPEWELDEDTEETTPPSQATVEQAQPAPATSTSGPDERAARLRASRAPAAAAQAPAGEARHAVAVVDVDRVYLPDGTSRSLPLTVQHVGHLEQIGRELGLRGPVLSWRDQAPGQVVPTPAMWAHLGVPVIDPVEDWTKREAALAAAAEATSALTDAVADGWVLGSGDGAPRLRGQLRLRPAHLDRAQITVLYTPAMDPGLCSDVFGADVAPADQVARLQLFAQTMGSTWSGSAISTMQDLVRVLMPRAHREAWAQVVDYDDVAPGRNRNLEPDFDWTRPPTQEETGRAFVHAYDRNGSYLAAMSNAVLGVGAPDHHPQGLAFDPKRAGWWLVEIPEPDNTLAPNLLDPTGSALRGKQSAAGRTRWVTTAALTYATTTLGMDVDVLEAWVWPRERSGRLLEPAYRHLSAARRQLQALGGPDAAAVERLMKALYKQFLGWLIARGSRGSQWHQPYWNHAVKATARVAVLHTVNAIGTATGTWPVAVSRVDAVLYASDERDPAAAWPGHADPAGKLGAKLGTALGGYKPYLSGPLATQLPTLDGGSWKNSEADLLTPVDDWATSAAQPAADNGVRGGEVA